MPVTDEDSQGNSGEQTSPFGQPTQTSETPATPPLGGPVPPTSPPAAPPGSFPPVYPPGYAPSPGAEPSYQAPAPWAPTAFPQTAGYSPVGSPPGPPIVGHPGYSNGALPEPPTRRPRRRMVTVVVIVLVVALILAGASAAIFVGGSNTTVSNPSKAASSPAARELLQSALAAARRMNAFHYVATSSLSGTQGFTQKTIGDAGPTSGRQIITVAKQKFTVLVVGKACYLKGNAAALMANLGLDATQAAAQSEKWISLASTDAPYASVYAAVTAPSALTDNITVKPQSQLPAGRVDGRRVQTVTGAIAPLTIGGQTQTLKGTASLAVRASTPHLPVRYTERGNQKRQTSQSTVTFNRWGEAVHITAPSDAVSYASLGVSPGSTPTTPSGTVLT